MSTRSEEIQRYREQYNKRHDVIIRKRGGKAPQDLIEQRKEYNNRPDVLERKQYLARLRRAYMQHLEEQKSHPPETSTTTDF